jgi:hypothetical protein
MIVRLIFQFYTLPSVDKIDCQEQFDFVVPDDFEWELDGDGEKIMTPEMAAAYDKWVLDLIKDKAADYFNASVEAFDAELYETKEGLQITHCGMPVITQPENLEA